ncbi:coiled-coil domain-containing protein 50 isoform X2 [Rhinatrema bivittatum]|uniref:coiled-coil domain-containing protein 50 isoform X2 n=1 Tax=Rhinatrema bivittatum TaxID=194408 RepID=UPI001128066F|nr:coiled-coil domain-containing protein 50 isoform X2 [Rhinatrema bivittatum]
MAEPGIDQSKLPGVKEVCRDFAVLEDHTLAHSLQEQEIEHHLASNIQRTRLVQHDLLVAKKLQEEEDLKARARIQKLHKHLEHQDCEIAQEIQEKLVIEAEQRRRQEEKDEDIARILQERELKEKKKQKQQQQLVEGPGHEPYEDGYYQETGDRARGRYKEHSRDPPRSHERNRKPQSKSKHPQPALCTDASDQQRPAAEDPGARRAPRQGEHRNRPSSWSERPARPPLPRCVRDADVDTEPRARGQLLNPDQPRSHSQERLGSRASPDARRHDSEAWKGRELRWGEPCGDKRASPRSPSPYNGRARDHPRDPGMGSRGARDATYGKMQADVKQLELQDAQIARRLQEEELRATRTDMRAAQVAQDEEIARLLMAEEKKAYKKAKEREKVFSDKRRQEPEWQTEAGEHVRPRSRDAYEGHRSKSDKPARPLPPSLSDHVESECRRPQHSSARPAAKLESAQKAAPL